MAQPSVGRFLDASKRGWLAFYRTARPVEFIEHAVAWFARTVVALIAVIVATIAAVCVEAVSIVGKISLYILGIVGAILALWVVVSAIRYFWTHALF